MNQKVLRILKRARNGDNQYQKKIKLLTNDRKKYRKVRDHHYTGEYRGAPHNICNLKYSVPK